MPKSCNGVAVDEVCGSIIPLSLSGAQIVIEMARFFARSGAGRAIPVRP
jgi:hypothetical protein